MKVTEEKLVEKIQEWIRTADSDELARLAGDLLGGKCTSEIVINIKGEFVESKYEFEPNEFYYGAFGNKTEST